MNTIDAQIEELDKLLIVRRNERAMRWSVNVFSGPPPHSYDSWEEWARTMHKTGAFIRASTPRDWGEVLKDRRGGESGGES